MKLLLTCPNRQFVVGNPTSQDVMNLLNGLGFTFIERDIPGGRLASCDGPVWYDIETMEDLLALQRMIGLPLRLEDGVLEIGG